MEHVIIIPTLEPSTRSIGLVDDLHAQGFKRIVVVDDGSDEGLFAPIFVLLEERGCTVIHHGRNFGKGTAIKTGIAQAQREFPDAPGYITVDGDGQHLACDARAVAERAKQVPSSLVLGVRDFSARGVPLRSRIGNAVSSWMFRLATGVICNDTQTGLRVIPRSLTEEALSCPGERFEYEMSFLVRAAQASYPIELVEISTVYLAHNRGSHFDTLHDSSRVMHAVIRELQRTLMQRTTRKESFDAA